MENQLYKLIDICEYYQIENTFIHGLHYHGLIEFLYIDSQAYIEEEQLNKIEKYHNWHKELELNIQALDVVEQLLEKITDLQQKVKLLSNR